jgi:ribosome recycling factor
MDSELIQLEFNEAVDHLTEDMAQIQTGRATTELVEEIRVSAYDTMSPLQNVANIAVMDSKTITISPWDKLLVDVIAKAVTDAKLGLSVTAEGDLVRVKVPDLTEERRKEYVKLMKERAESTRQQVRAIRQNYMQELETMVKDAKTSEDEGKRFEELIEKMVKDANEKIEVMKDKKEEDLMNI